MTSSQGHLKLPNEKGQRAELGFGWRYAYFRSDFRKDAKRLLTHAILGGGIDSVPFPDFLDSSKTVADVYAHGRRHRGMVGTYPPVQNWVDVPPEIAIFKEKIINIPIRILYFSVFPK